MKCDGKRLLSSCENGLIILWILPRRGHDNDVLLLPLLPLLMSLLRCQKRCLLVAGHICRVVPWMCAEQEGIRSLCNFICNKK